jgi:CDGSH-type Zn-finger protein
MDRSAFVPSCINGSPAGHRATLCRCGASRHKPFCDNSHAAVSFSASGEPDKRESQPLLTRNGRLDVRPQPNGPLVVEGNVELCSGTGRTIERTTAVRLCRCGASANKPFCDGSHARVGFQADS